MQHIHFVLGSHFPENTGLRKEQFRCPHPLYLLWVFTPHLALGQEMEWRWLFRWAQTKTWISLAIQTLAGQAWHNACRHHRRPPGCWMPPAIPIALPTAFPLENELSLPAGTSGSSKGASCAKHYRVERKKSLFWWLRTEEARVSETAFLQQMNEFSWSPIKNMETNVNL